MRYLVEGVDVIRMLMDLSFRCHLAGYEFIRIEHDIDDEYTVHTERLDQILMKMIEKVEFERHFGDVVMNHMFLAFQFQLDNHRHLMMLRNVRIVFKK